MAGDIISIAIMGASSVASWVGVIYVIRNTGSSKLEKTIASAIEIALLKMKGELGDEFVDVDYCKGMGQRREDSYRRVEELSQFTHHGLLKLANILTAVILFVKNVHRDTPMDQTLDDAIRSLRNE